MRLIDADMLLREINGFSMRITGSANAMALAIMDETKKSIMRIIDEQPTAYDVDKVVERLEEDAKYFQSEADELAQVGDFGTATELQGKAAAYRDAVKTVKSGGIA